MFGTLFEKELKAILLSPKFVATFGVCSLLILLSVFIGIQEHRAAVDQYETAIQLADQEIREATSWWGVNNRVYRRPNPMQIFASGVNNDIGRLSNISTWTEVKLRQSTYSDDSLFALFRFIDFTFIVQVVLSLFAILFTYDAINGERESGTLKLAFSNAVPRGTYMLAKFLGSWVGLTAPLLIPIALALLVVMILQVPMTGVEWLKLLTLIGISILYFTFFIMLGLLVSALTKRSTVSFLILLVAWVLCVLIMPRAATMAAGQIVEVPSIAEVESQKDRFRTDRWSAYGEERSANWRERMQGAEGMNEDERQQFMDENRPKWMQEDDDSRQLLQEEIAENERKVNEDLRNRKSEQERLAFVLSRFSPSSSYQLAAMNLAGTNTTLKARYEESMRIYRTAFSQFVEDKRVEERKKMMEQQRGQRRVMIFGSGNESLDVSELPRFEAPSHSFSEAFAPSVVDVGLLALFSVLCFAGAFVAFLRYDVR